jgi:hypothetical protein
VTCQLAQPVPWTAGLTSARLLLGVDHDVDAVAAMLGLDADQLRWGGDGALHAELDLPPGSWRIWPDRGAALWVSARPGVPAPATRGGRRLSLARIVRALRRRGVRARELRLYDGERWGPSMRALDALIALDASDACGICGVWSAVERHPTRVEVFDDGTLWASTPVDAAWWAMEAACDE